MQTAEGMARLGTETAFEVLARAAELERQGKDIINLGIGQPDFKTPDHVVEAAIKALKDGHHGYSRLHPSPRHPGIARSRGQRHPRPPRRRGLPRQYLHHARWQAHHVLCHHDVRRAGGRDHVS